MLEIEKKYLLKYLPDLSIFKGKVIYQGYLCFCPEIRIRKKGNKYFITEKSDGTQIRREIETEIDEITFQILTSLVKGRIIKKTRFNIPLYDGLIAELDVYHDELNGLYTVETEFSSLEQADSFTAPSWFGTDITEDKRYKNKNLARMEDISVLLPNAQNQNLSRVRKKEQNK